MTDDSERNFKDILDRIVEGNEKKKKEAQAVQVIQTAEDLANSGFAVMEEAFKSLEEEIEKAEPEGTGNRKP
jgi:hypothetical protein